MNHPPILLGTSSFTATGWQGSFYPKGLRPVDYLSYYAQHFDTVEINSTFYATPNVSVVRSWSAKTPEGFLFAAKVPQEITRKRVLKDCDEEFKVFLTTMEALGEKLGPLLFQFGKFDKTMFRSLDDFLGRLVPFLKRLPKEHKFAVEIRNKDWLVPKLADVLREHGVALTLIDQGWMPRPWEMKDKFDLITSDLTYVRWLGDRKGIEEKTTTWDKVIVDRQGDLSEWVSLLKKVQERRIMILAFANNHYAAIALTKVDPHLCSDNWPTNRFTANVLSAVCLCFFSQLRPTFTTTCASPRACSTNSEMPCWLCQTWRPVCAPNFETGDSNSLISVRSAWNVTPAACSSVREVLSSDTSSRKPGIISSGPHN